MLVEEEVRAFLQVCGSVFLVGVILAASGLKFTVWGRGEAGQAERLYLAVGRWALWLGGPAAAVAGLGLIVGLVIAWLGS